MMLDRFQVFIHDQSDMLTRYASELHLAVQHAVAQRF
jgi:hypothetical protein